MSNTGFTVNGIGDLSTILKARTSAAGPATNFIASDSRDLNQWFEMSATPGNANADQITYNTNYDMSYNGIPTDLRYMFQKYPISPISFSPSENFMLVQSGSNYILSCIANSEITNTVTFNVGISNVNFVIVAGGGGGGSSSEDAEDGGGGGEGGEVSLMGLATAQTSNYVTLIIGDGGASSTNGNSSTVNFILGGMTFSQTANPGVKGNNAAAGGAGGNSGHNGGNGGRGGYSSNNSVNGSASTQTLVNIFGTNYYFSGGGGGGSYDGQPSSSFGGLGGGRGGGNGTTGNNGQIYTTPYNVSYNPLTTNSFPNSGGGGSGGNGNGFIANKPGGTGNSGIIVIYFTYP